MTNANQETKVVTGEVRFSFCHLFEPAAAIEGQDKKYSLCILIPKSDTGTIKKITDAFEAVKAASAQVWGGKVPRDLKLPLRDGDEKDSPEYRGMYFINASSKQKPGIVDKALNEILDAAQVYSGCYGKVSLNFFAYNQAGNRGIGAGLNNVQKLRDGDYLGGRSRAEDDFEAIEDDDDPLA